MSIISGPFPAGRTEIVIRRRTPVEHASESIEERGSAYKLPPAKGFLDFYPVLKRVV